MGAKIEGFRAQLPASPSTERKDSSRVSAPGRELERLPSRQDQGQQVEGFVSAATSRVKTKTGWSQVTS